MVDKETKKLGTLADIGLFILCWLGTITVWCVYREVAGIREEKTNSLLLSFVACALYGVIVSLINKSRGNSSSNAGANSKNNPKK